METVTLFKNGRVFTPGLGFSDSFAVKGDKFIPPEEALNPDNTIDLKGQFVCPGFIDTHMHLVGHGRSITSCVLDDHSGSLKEVITYMKDFLRENPPQNGMWFFARGWNEDKFTDEKRPINRHDLDGVSSEIPIYCGRTCGHCVCVNTKALELMGVTVDTPDIPGGRIGVENGELTGMIYDNAIDFIRSAMPSPSVPFIKELIVAACRQLNSFGVTGSMTDDFTALYRWEKVMQAYKELEAEGRLTVRIYQQSYFDKPEKLEEFNAAGYTTGVGTDMYRIGPLKMIADGAVGAHTAYLTKPYADMPETCGAFNYSQEVLDEMIGLANRKDMQIAIHAIGDGCVDMAMNAFEKAFAEHPRTEHRDTLIHCLVTRPDQLPRMKKLGLRVHFQSEFLDYHCRIAVARLGKERAHNAYAWKSMKDLGIGVSNSSDAPVEIPSPMRGIQLAVTRRPLDGTGEPLNLKEAFTLEEAIAGYTTDAAMGSFDENKKGKIAVGFLADFIILSEDPFKCDPMKLSQIKVLETWLNGKKVYGLLENKGHLV
ncbi:MAG: amidohydrolase [Lachnospiraceae bacterium]|nr:amidohydrolase [Lachnospiraceae bacterium]